MIISIFRSAGNLVSRFSLRGKTLFITVLILLTLVILAGIGVDILIRRSFSRLENEWIKENAERIQQLIAAEADGIRRMTYDYAVWSDTYYYALAPDMRYTDSNFTLDVFKNLQIYGAFIYSSKGARITGYTMKDDESGIAAAGPGWDSILGSIAREISAGENRGISGLIRFDNKVFFISCNQILKDGGAGPPAGAFIHLRIFNQILLDRLSSVAGLKISIGEMFGDRGRFNESYKMVNNYYYRIIGRDTVSLVIPFLDINNKEVVAGVTSLERRIHHEGERARFIFYILLSLIVIVAGSLNQYLIKKLVIFRLERMMKGIRIVEETLDLSRRLQTFDNDELDGLAGAVNRMLDSLEDEKRRHDIAEREKEMLQEYMLQAKKMEAMGTMAGGIAHDFNNMLVIILGSAELLRTDLTAGHPALEHVESIEKAGQNASALVRRMMTINKGFSASRAYFSVSHAITEMLGMVKANLPGYININLYNEIADDLIYADIAQFQQVIVNLVTNSAHAMAGRSKGSLDINIREVFLPRADYRAETVSLSGGRYIRIEFADTGNGIPADIRERIFEPFFSTKPVGSGTGLGLAVVHSFVVNNGGSIGVESEEGKGTTFIIHLPTVEERRKPVVPQDGMSARILLVDDDSLVRKTVASGLKRMGHEVYEASGGNSALKILAEKGELINLVITDQMMPGMSGHELSARIRSLYPGLPVVLISGYLSGLDDTGLETGGFMKVLMKPASISDLDNIIKETLTSGKSF